MSAAIVAYEQPVSRADVAHIRSTDSAGVIDTLLARKLIADDARTSGRGRPAFLVTTDRFLQVMGLASLAELPPRRTVTGAHCSEHYRQTRYGDSIVIPPGA